MLYQSRTNSFQAECLQAVHDLLTDTIKIALYTANASLGPTTTEYTTTEEVVGTGYTAGGLVLTNPTINIYAQNSIDPGVIYVDFDNAVWSPAAFTARGALIYNASKSNKSVAVLDFGSDKTCTTSFTVQLPPNTSSAALLRFV